MYPAYPTAAQLIRDLRPHFAGTYELNVAVAAHRRAHGCKNWHAAALALLATLPSEPQTIAAGL